VHDHACRFVIGELLVECEAERGKELHRFVEIANGDVDEQFSGHDVLQSHTSAAKRKELAEALVAQPESAPKQRGDINRKEDVRCQRIAYANMRGDGAAEVSGPENRTEDGGAWDEIEREADELNRAERQDDVARIAELLCGIDRGGKLK